MEIKSKKKISRPGSGSYYEIVMADGSEWVCDERGENWKRAQFSNTEFDLDENQLLNKFINRKKTR